MPLVTLKALQLSKAFSPTHPTGGLDGYPAIDEFAAPGTVVLAPAAGTIRKLSGKNPALGGKPGGAYGWSLYLLRADGREHFLTHMGSRFVTTGQKVARGEPIGTVCSARVVGSPASSSHIHNGLRRSA